MKSLILSVKPKHCVNILNGLKTIEIRKRFPIEYRGWVYIYCTKDNIETLYKNKEPLGEEYYDYVCVSKKGKDYNIFSNDINLNGKVIARFYCDNVEEIENRYCKGMLIDSCLSNSELNDYLGNNNGYAIHISNIEIFDTPKELSEFKTLRNCSKCFARYDEMECFNIEPMCPNKRKITKAPQNLMYIETE